MHVEQYPQEQAASRKGKERDTSQRDLPQTTDLDEKLTALRRRTAASVATPPFFPLYIDSFFRNTRPRDRSERERMQVAQALPLNNSSSTLLSRPDRSPKLSTTQRHPPSSPRRHASPQVIVSRTTHEADHEDFSRRLNISSSPSPRPSPVAHKQGASSKLFNPNTDPIPMRRTAEPEVMSDATGSSYVVVPRGGPSSTSANHREERGNAARQLFDHRKDDPVRFSVLARPPGSGSGRPAPASKSSADYVSASSTSSYAASISSSTFTLSSTTDGSSTSSALFEGRPNQGAEDAGNNVFSIQLKKLYRAITNLETKIKQEYSDDADEGMHSRVVLKGKEVENDDLEKEKWKKQIYDHKE